MPHHPRLAAKLDNNPCATILINAGAAAPIIMQLPQRFLPVMAAAV